MAKRGRIVRDPTTGPGLMMVQGRQHVFGLDGVWKSDALPRPGVVVDVEFDDAGAVSAVTAVPEARLAREQLEAALALARSGGAYLGAGLVGRLGLLQLAALGLLVISWFWLGVLDVDATLPGHWQATFWHIVGALDAGRSLDVPGNGSAPTFGLYRLVALVCLAGPLLACLWHNKRAHLASLLPLAFMLIVVLQSIELVRSVGEKTVSMGEGAFLAALASLYFALAGIKRFLVAKAHDGAVFYENE